MPRKRDPAKVPPGHRKNLETLLRAAADGALGLMQLRRADGSGYDTVLTAFRRDGGEVHISPLARLFDGNPFEFYEAPAGAPEGEA